MGTVVGLFNGYAEADRAVSTLTAASFDHADLGIVAQESAIPRAGGNGDGTIVSKEAADGAGHGAVVGGIAGLLVGVAAMAIPGLGPLFVAGVVASVLTSTVAGATAGALTGGVLGLLTELSIPEEDARLFADGVKAGGILVTVHTDRDAEAAEILRAANAVTVKEFSPIT